MTEVVEYSLVVMVSTLFVTGSVVTYGTFSSFEANLQLKAAFASISNLASQAAVNGSSWASVSLPSSIIRCEDGTLSITASSLSEGQTVPIACNFEVDVVGGTHIVHFSDAYSQLVVSVT